MITEIRVIGTVGEELLRDTVPMGTVIEVDDYVQVAWISLEADRHCITLCAPAKITRLRGKRIIIEELPVCKCCGQPRE